MYKIKFLLLFTGLVLSFHCFSWNVLGHMVAVNIAYERLHPQVREKVDKMVIGLSQEYPEIQYFTQIAPWPDALRAQKIDTFTHWHYIDFAFSVDATPVQDLTDDDNAVWAINKIEPVIRNVAGNAFERGRFLAFLVHIVADLHQPLHTVSRISTAHPNGDHGGNLYFVHYSEGPLRAISLHKLWAEGLGIFSGDPSQQSVAALTKVITSLYPEEYFGTKVHDLSTDNWAREGTKIAELFVYSTLENHVPNLEYMNKGKEIVNQRIALSGYRLANLLNQLLD